jgi:hypothetical protein
MDLFSGPGLQHEFRPRRLEQLVTDNEENFRVMERTDPTGGCI